ncbi:MAG: hypothetical protein RL329_729 [Bacteroidota bacterium]
MNLELQKSLKFLKYLVFVDIFSIKCKFHCKNFRKVFFLTKFVLKNTLRKLYTDFKQKILFYRKNFNENQGNRMIMILKIFSVESRKFRTPNILKIFKIISILFQKNSPIFSKCFYIESGLSAIESRRSIRNHSAR